MPKGYVEAVTQFLRSGGIISWSIVPTDSSTLEREIPERLAGLLWSYWEVVAYFVYLGFTLVRYFCPSIQKEK